MFLNRPIGSECERERNSMTFVYLMNSTSRNIDSAKKTLIKAMKGDGKLCVCNVYINMRCNPNITITTITSIAIKPVYTPHQTHLQDETDQWTRALLETLHVYCLVANNGLTLSLCYFSPLMLHVGDSTTFATVILCQIQQA